VALEKLGHMLAVDRRKTDAIAAGEFKLRVVSELAENTNSIFGDSSSELETANGCPVLRGIHAQRRILINVKTTLEARTESRAFLLTSDLHGRRSLVLKPSMPTASLGIYKTNHVRF
jgi:hypothetical protein